MNALRVNEKTGFLESPSPNSTTFDSVKKQTFLELANQQAENEESPNITKLCKKLGITLKTFYNHLREDEVFREAWDETRLKIEDALQRSLIRQGVKGSQGVTAAIFWLKNRVGERWSDGDAKTFLDVTAFQKVLVGNQPFIDAEIVQSPTITSTPLQINTNLHEKVVDKGSPSENK